MPWTKHIVELTTRRNNVYTDLSYFLADSLPRVKEQVYDRLPDHVRTRIMYGSDFVVLMKSTPSVADYLMSFKLTFGDEFDNFSIDNPRRFLFDRG